MKCDTAKAKYAIMLQSNKHTHALTTQSVIDQRSCESWTQEQMHQRGIVNFADVKDMAETLNWNLNGDASKFVYKFGQSGKDTSTVYAYIFD